MAKAVFYSFHYNRDAWRVQQVRNMGVLDGQPLLNAQEWEQVRRQGDTAIQQWIKDQMAYKSAVVVLIGAETASRPWVRHEIAHAWDNRKPLVGVRIHGLADRNGYTDPYGENPFSKVALKGGGTVGDYVPVYNPTGWDSRSVYASICANLTDWVASAYKRL
ncbi:TIR domain-containing protein [Luteococcus japonicus]|uniref:TIR domain-containing protein n=1 Tax=Luteococcus japonicus TaxID=33984 RepID=UPI000B9C33CD|nr:TIR domain-containing protein [Luteococcus japonicus]